MLLWDYPSIYVTFSCPAGPSVNFLYGCRTFCQIPLRLQDFPSTLCGRWTILPLSVTCRTFCQLCAGVEPYVTFWHVFVLTGKFPSTYINFPCSRRTLCKLLSTFSVATGPSVNFTNSRGNFCEISVLPMDIVNFLCFHRTFLCQVAVQPLELPSTSINFACGRRTFINILHGHRTICQLSMWPWGLFIRSC